MGNQPSTNPIEEFVLSLTNNEESTKFTDKLKLMKSLYEIYKEFKMNPNKYKEFKEEEEKEFVKSSLMMSKDSNDANLNVQSKETKAKKFQTILSDLIMKEFKHEETYALLFRIIRFLLSEIKFVSYLLNNGIEQIISMITGDKTSAFLFIEACELLNDFLTVLQKNPNIIEKQFSILQKIYSIPMKINKFEFNNKDCMRVLCKIIKNCAQLLLVLQEEKKKTKKKFDKEDSDFLKNIRNDYNTNNLFPNCVKLIEKIKIDDIIDYLNEMQTLIKKKNESEKEVEIGIKELFSKLETATEEEICQTIRNEIEKEQYKDSKKQLKDFKETTPFLIINSFIIFNASRLSNTKVEVTILLGFIFDKQLFSEQKDDKQEHLETFREKFYNQLKQEIMTYIISYFISYDQQNKETINILHPNDKNFHNKIEYLFELFEKTYDQELKFLVCLLFCAIGIHREVFTFLSQRNILNPTLYYIIAYIKATFNYRNENNNEKHINKQEEMFQLRLSEIQKLVEIFGFVSKNEIFKNIKHVDYFKFYFDVILLLFYINFPKCRFETLNIMNVFTLFSPCKKVFCEKKNKPVQKKLLKYMEDLFTELKDSEALTMNLMNLKAQLVEKINTQKGSKLDLLKLVENLELYKSQIVNAKQSFFAIAREFLLTISIFVNLMLSDQFERDILIITNDNLSGLNESSNQDKPFNIETFYIYHNFFKNLKELKPELSKSLQNYQIKFLSMYVLQIPLAILIHNPKAKIILGDDEQNDNDEIDINNPYCLDKVYSLFELNKENYEILHKIIYAINRYFCRIKDLEYMKIIIEEITILLSKNPPLYVVRECFRLFYTLSLQNNNCFFWLQFDLLNSCLMEKTNSHDFFLKYRDDHSLWKLKNSIASTDLNQSNNTSQTHSYNKVMDEESCIFLPQPIILSDAEEPSFTILFQFYNPVPNNSKWHTLFQDCTGLFSIIAINKFTDRIGSFLSGDETFLDSGINLANKNLQNKWIKVALSFQNLDTKASKGILLWYFNWESELESKTKSTHKHQTEITLKVHNIQYIGNNRDYDEPFGEFSDVQIYRKHKHINDIKKMFSTDIRNNKEMNKNLKILNFLFEKTHNQCIQYALSGTKYLSEEVLSFFIKFINNIMNEKKYRWSFANFEFILKISNEGFEYSSLEIKKELIKFLKMVS